jgi:hypothetical protein
MGAAPTQKHRFWVTYSIKKRLRTSPHIQSTAWGHCQPKAWISRNLSNNRVEVSRTAPHIK